MSNKTNKNQKVKSDFTLDQINEFVRELTAQMHFDVLNVKEEREDNRLDRFNDAFRLVQKRGAPPLGRFELPDNLFPYRRRGNAFFQPKYVLKCQSAYDE